jgi:(p)ppGpp synthase/HD superfamily hydrolase
MNDTFKKTVAFLNEAGFGNAFLYERSHTGHLGATYHYLREWGCSDQTCSAGLLHSVIDPDSGYGNPPMRLEDLPSEIADEKVRKLIVGYFMLERQANGADLHPQALTYEQHVFHIDENDLRDIADIAVADRIDQVDWCWRKHNIAPTSDVLGFLKGSGGWANRASPTAARAYQDLLAEAETSSEAVS